MSALATVMGVVIFVVLFGGVLWGLIKLKK